MFFVINGKLREGECNFLKAIESANSTIQIITWKILTPNLVGWILEYVSLAVVTLTCFTQYI